MVLKAALKFIALAGLGLALLGDSHRAALHRAFREPPAAGPAATSSALEAAAASGGDLRQAAGPGPVPGWIPGWFNCCSVQVSKDHENIDMEELDGERDSKDDLSAYQEEDRLTKAGEPVNAGEPICAVAEPQGRRVVTMADQHGDFRNMVKHLKRLGIVSQEVTRNKATWAESWVGGRTLFIQMGDILDRGLDGRLMYRFLWDLQDQARRAEGEVVLLIGNHEHLVMKGSAAYAAEADVCRYAECSGSESEAESCLQVGGCCDHDQCAGRGECLFGSCWGKCMPGLCNMLAAWDKDGALGKEMRERFQDGRMKVAYRVNGMVFVHAGLVLHLWDKVGEGADIVDVLNSEARDLFANNDGKALSTSKSSILDTLNGPLWTRVGWQEWYKERETFIGKAVLSSKHFQGLKNRCSVVQKSSELAGADRVVIGHCPQGDDVNGLMVSKGIATHCGGALVLTDTFMSRAYSGSNSASLHNMAALEFYSGEHVSLVWRVYVGREESAERCRQLPDTQQQLDAKLAQFQSRAQRQPPPPPSAPQEQPKNDAPRGDGPQDGGPQDGRPEDAPQGGGPQDWGDLEFKPL